MPALFLADIRGPIGPVGSWPNLTPLLSTANLGTLGSGAYTPISGDAATSMGLPTNTRGTLINYVWELGTTQTWIPSTSAGNQMWQRVKVGTAWQEWGRIDSGVTTLLSSADIDNLESGHYMPISTAAAATMGLPAANVGPLTVSGRHGSTAQQQMFIPISTTPRIYIRSRVSTAWSTWAEIVPGDGGGGAQVSSPVEREMRVAQANARRGGIYGTGGLAVFSLMFDHGTNNFISKILPLLQKHNMPAGLGLNSQMYDPGYQFASSDNQTTFAQLQAMALQNGVALWNHGRLHNGGGEPEIVGGRDEMTTSLPLIPVENWLHTGAYGDFDSGSSFNKYWENAIGSVIMNSHAYLTGDIQEPVKQLTGQLKPGYDGQWVDGGQYALDFVKTHIQNAQKVGGGVMLRHHPMYLDTAGYLSTAELDTFLGWVATERDAGRLLVLTPDMLNLADADRTRRRNLVDGTGGTGDQDRLIPASMYEQAVGSVNEIHARARLDTAGTIQLQVSGTGLSASKTFTVPANTWVDLRKFFTIPFTGTATLNVTCRALTGTGLQVEKLNVFPG